jgi:RNase P/RNase MRP subunit p30
VRIARAFEVPVVLSSGASEEWMMRKPREMAALSSLFDVSTEEALKAVSNCPIEMVERNRRKLDSRFVAPGIRVVRRGKNC